MVLTQHDEGRIVAERNESGTFTGYEYQYNLKDHLGNVRTTFKTDIDSDDIYLATLETAYATTEEGQFGNLPTTRETDAVYNHTPADATVTSPNKSAMLNASLTNADGTRRVVGPTMSLHVFPGDTVDMEVYAKYANTCGVSETTASAFLFASLAAASGISAVGETAKAYQALDGATGATALFDQSSCDVPKAFLNYILFDKNFSNPTIGFVQVSSTAGTQFEELSLSKSINKEGYLYIYVSNESTLNANVYFDDMKVTHKHTPIVQKDDYYPFGLTFNHYEKPGTIDQRFKFQGQEHVDDLGLNWDSFKWRNHQPDLGRFFNVDPLAEKYVYNSPYAFAENKLGMGIELEGLEVFTGAFTAEFIAIRASLKSSNGPINRLISGSSNDMPKEVSSNGSTMISNETLAKMRDVNEIVENVSHNAAVVTNEASKITLETAKMVGTALELTGVGAPEGVIINSVAEGLDQARQAKFEGKNVEDAILDGAIDIGISTVLGGAAKKAKTAVRTNGSFKEGEGQVFDAVLDASTKTKEVILKEVIDEQGD